jgi:hypothetical protein
VRSLFTSGGERYASVPPWFALIEMLVTAVPPAVHTVPDGAGGSTLEPSAPCFANLVGKYLPSPPPTVGRPPAIPLSRRTSGTTVVSHLTFTASR